MPTSLTKDKVYERVLDQIGEVPVVNVSSPYVNWLNRNYIWSVELLIRSYNWNFAREMAALPEDAVTPGFNWLHRYALPSDALRILPPREGGKRTGRPLDHEVNGGYIYANVSGPLMIYYLKRVEEPGQWDPIFAQLVAADLSLAAANKFTGKSSYIQLLTKLRGDTLELAEQIEAFEGDLDPVDEMDIIRVRDPDYYPSGDW